MRSVENAECGKCVENFNFPFQFPIPMLKNSVLTIKKIMIKNKSKKRRCIIAF